MYNPDTDLLFPPRLLPHLRNLRSPAWGELVGRMLQKDPTSPERVAFILLMARLHGCATCQADSYRGMQGCTQCSQQTVKRLRTSDEELNRQFLEACHEVEQYLGND